MNFFPPSVCSRRRASHARDCCCWCCCVSREVRGSSTSLVLGASKFHEADSTTTVPNLLLLLATQNLSLQFQFPDLQVHGEAFAEEETDGERQRQRDRRNGKFRVLCVCGAVDGGNGGKMGPVLACSATGVALPESMS